MTSAVTFKLFYCHLQGQVVALVDAVSLLQVRVEAEFLRAA